MGFYNINFSLRVGRFNSLTAQYDNEDAQTITLNYDGASFLYHVAMSIIYGPNSENELQAVYRRANDIIVLDYKRQELGSAMLASLIIDKKHQSAPFEFPSSSYQVKEDDKIVTKFIQSGLGVFAMTLRGYLTGVGADLHLRKLPEGFENQEQNQQGFNATVNGREYQKEDYDSYSTF